MKGNLSKTYQMDKMKKDITASVGEDMEQLELWHNVSENGKWNDDCGKLLGDIY